jgi:hypothetical protein
MKTATAPLPPLRSVKVLDQLRERIRYLHYSLRTEQAYVHWVRARIDHRQQRSVIVTINMLPSARSSVFQTRQLSCRSSE